MAVSISDLSKFREAKAAGIKEPWRLEPIVPRLGLTILAVDQSLGNAGWAIIERDGSIGECGNLKTTSTLTGHAGTLDQGSRQFGMFLDLVRSYSGVGLVVHETPPISRPGMKMQRPESSLVSANSLRNAAHVVGIDVHMVSAQKAKVRFTGNAKAEKREVAAGLALLDPSLLTRKPLNEHIRDAIALGWLACEEGP